MTLTINNMRKYLYLLHLIDPEFKEIGKILLQSLLFLFLLNALLLKDSRNSSKIAGSVFCLIKQMKMNSEY